MRWFAGPLGARHRRYCERLLEPGHDWYDARCGWWTRAALSGVLALAMVRAACVIEAGGDTGPLVLYGGEPNGDDGDASGTLVREGECIYLVLDHDNDGSQDGRMLLAFPDRFIRWDDDRQAIRRGRHLLRTGVRIEVGGSTLSTPALAFDWASPPGPSCDSSVVWMSK